MMASLNHHNTINLVAIIAVASRSLLVIALFCGFLLKLFSFNYIPSTDSIGNGLLYHVSAVIELMLASWLVMSMNSKNCLMLITAFFSIGLVQNLRLLGTSKSCECFGSFAVQPITSVAINLICLAACFVALNTRAKSASPTDTSDPIFNRYTIISCVCLSLLIYYYSTNKYILNQFIYRDIAVILDDNIDLGDGSPGDVKEFDIRVLNNSTDTINIAGFKAGCTCMSSTALPLEIAAGATRVVRVRYRYTDSIASSIHIGFYIEKPSIWISTRVNARAKQTTAQLRAAE